MASGRLMTVATASLIKLIDVVSTTLPPSPSLLPSTRILPQTSLLLDARCSGGDDARCVEAAVNAAIRRAAAVGGSESTVGGRGVSLSRQRARNLGTAAATVGRAADERRRRSTARAFTCGCFAHCSILPLLSVSERSNLSLAC